MSSSQVIAAVPPTDPKAEPKPDPFLLVIFGASGDLAKGKLFPALFHLEQSGLLPQEFGVVGVARRDLSANFAPDMKDGILKYGGVKDADPKLLPFMEHVEYFATNFDDNTGYDNLRYYLSTLDKKFGTSGNRLFYLAVAPEFFADIIARLGKHGMAHPEEGTNNWVRVIIEKPFGTDLPSARRLNDQITAVLSEDQIFRIDHYLGKGTVQNILVFRFANGIFEPVWNSHFIDHVEITAAESIGIEGRGPFYEKAGALRDVLQNHVMEVLSLVAMEPPDTFAAKAMAVEKLKVWRSIKPIPTEDAVRGQYGPGTIDGKAVIGYRQEDRVAADSSTETYAAVSLEIANERWGGVPFYLRAGKRLAEQVTEVDIVFKQTPLQLFGSGSDPNGIAPNTISIRIQPDGGISFCFGVKTPGPITKVAAVNVDFNYAEAFGTSSANGYERLLLDALLGDASLFVDRDGVEATWAVFTLILEAWKEQPQDFPNYVAGTWGPKASDALLERDGRKWYKL